ncbi:hypothetical protein BDR05DRAFT_1006603 [Suillus weaverae]|nr:hypothetical protein BDR05DRAFT_1006603 [Suillus weaverae]
MSDSDDGILQAPLMVDKQLEVQPNYRRPVKLCRTYAMRDVALPEDEDDEQSADSDMNGSDHESSATDSEDEDSAAMKLFDEVTSVVTNKQQVASKSRGTAPTRKLQTSDTKTRSITSPVQTESGKSSSVRNHGSQVPPFFANSYPELVDKNQVVLQALIVVAEKCGVHPIKEHLQSDIRYASQLGSLVDARVPILHRELKEDACANADGYFHLGHTDTGKAAVRRLLDKLAYIYALKFDINNEASPIGKKPYQGELLLFLIYRQLFHSSRSIAIKFTEHFIEIANNKGQRPEVPIPLLALVATAVIPSVEVARFTVEIQLYRKFIQQDINYHVRFLEKLKKDAPAKFHCMMADIYEAAQKLQYSGAAASGHAAELEAFELLDLDNMKKTDSSPTLRTVI